MAVFKKILAFGVFFFVFGFFMTDAYCEDNIGLEKTLAELMQKSNVSPDQCLCQLKAILERINPVKVIAKKTYQEDYSAGDIKNLITSEVTIEFWNVGSLAKGYDQATMKTRIRSSLTGETNESTKTGFFTGGPNGQIWLDSEGLRTRITVQNGRSLVVSGLETEDEDPEDLIIPISNPIAFSSWPPVDELDKLQRQIGNQQKMMQVIAEMQSSLNTINLNCIGNVK